jgi:hypothetical protein
VPFRSDVSELLYPDFESENRRFESDPNSLTSPDFTIFAPREPEIATEP